MKSCIAIVLLLVTAFRPAIAQQDTSRKEPVVPKNLSRTWIKLYDDKKVKKGMLYEVGSMSVTLSNTKYKKDYQEGKINTETFDVRTIDALSVERRTYLVEGGAAGTVFGFLVGGAIGLHYYFRTSEHNEPWLQDASTGALIGGGIGTIIGAFMTEKINIRINGSQVKFDQYKGVLREHSVK